MCHTLYPLHGWISVWPLQPVVWMGFYGNLMPQWDGKCNYLCFGKSYLFLSCFSRLIVFVFVCVCAGRDRSRRLRDSPERYDQTHYEGSHLWERVDYFLIIAYLQKLQKCESPCSVGIFELTLEFTFHSVTHFFFHILGFVVLYIPHRHRKLFTMKSYVPSFIHLQSSVYYPDWTGSKKTIW